MPESFFTPLFDEVRQHTGLVAAAVYGVVWRYCQMSEHVCFASLETMARQAGVGRRTVMRGLAFLEEEGWIIDLTPERRNATHVYQITSRLGHSGETPGDCSTADGGRGVTESRPAVTGNHSGSDKESLPAVTERRPGTTASRFGSDKESFTAVTGNHSRVTESHPGSNTESLPAVTQSHSTVTESHPAGPESHAGSDTEALPAVTESHLNQTLKRDFLTDESETQEEVVLPEWRYLLEIFENQFGYNNQFTNCLRKTRPLGYEGDRLLVAVPDAAQADLLNARIASTVSRMLPGIRAGPEARVWFVAGPDPPSEDA
jgi:hypothetical protein